MRAVAYATSLLAVTSISLKSKTTGASAHAKKKSQVFWYASIPLDTRGGGTSNITMSGEWWATIPSRSCARTALAQLSSSSRIAVSSVVLGPMRLILEPPDRGFGEQRSLLRITPRGSLGLRATVVRTNAAAPPVTRPCRVVTAYREDLRGDHADRPQPRFYESRPVCNGKLGLPEPEGVPPVGVHVQFSGHTHVLQCNVVRQGIRRAIHVVIFGMHEERRRRVARDVKIRVQRILAVVKEMSGIQRYGEIRTTALLVGGIRGWVRTAVKMRAHRGDQMSARGKPEHSDLVWIDVPLHCAKAHERDRPLRVF